MHCSVEACVLIHGYTEIRQRLSRSLCSINLSPEPSLSAIRNPRVQLAGGRAKPGCSAVRIDPCGRLVPPEGINQSPCCLGKSTPYQIFTASSPCDFSQVPTVCDARRDLSVAL
ncbi:Beta-14-galactosyltransferase 3 [Dissostichus eleginoides]|uniref:Beta-14-galactosyltransferase 3 n=1 Tax=Dissostichus eleginoides TaxID=100907 RepID=A0AAD9C0F9_DISEL|nr:Beta-14-galactosyltransferase 3 [Dissostichus eleginoides]